ncbi:MAG: precorrin-3B synthase [Actinomycetota bacterium]|nr:precorrin-3B synthase [Actinomycetota bacterium]
MLRSRPDACPGAWRRHDAADGALARFRPVGGAISADELRLLAGAAAVGGSPLELTSRGSLQVRGLAGSTADDLADALRAHRPEALLDTSGRDVPCGLLASPRSTRLDAVAAQVAAALRGRVDIPGRLLVALEDRATEVRKVSLSACSPGSDVRQAAFTTGDVSGQGADITVVLASSGPVPGSTTGQAPQERPLGEDPDAALLLDGPHGVLDTGLRHPDPAALALAAIDSFTTRRDTAWRVRELDAATRDALVADVRDRTTPDVVTPLLTPGPADPTALGPRDDGTLEVLPRLGELDLPLVAVLVGLLTAGVTLRATPWRTLVLRGLPDPTEAARRLEGLAETDPASRWRGVSACVGAPRCAKSHADVRGDLAAAVASGHVGGTVRQHWVGCARACGTPGGRVAVIEALAADEPGDGRRGTYRTVVRSGRVTG